jgi:hypothetical protein
MHTKFESAESIAHLYDWKDAEVDYCRSLVMSGATKNVPERSILSYLDTQIVSARKDGRPDCQQYLETLRAYWLKSARYFSLILQSTP